MKRWRGSDRLAPAAVSPVDGGAGRRMAPRSADGGAAEPGDLFVVREAAEFAVEWVVLTRDPGDRFLLQVVPADAHPATGSADVRVSARSAGGPLNLRCGFAVWVPQGLLAPELRSGSVAADDLVRAERRCRELAENGDRRDPLGRETDRDPEYLDWIAETVAPAAEVLRAAASSARLPRPPGVALDPPRRRRPLAFSALAAAALLLVAVGLAWRILALQSEIERLSRPVFDVPAGEVLFGATRNPNHHLVKLRLGRDASSFLLTVELGPDLAADAAGHLEIQDVAGHPLWRSPAFKLAPASAFNVVLTRRLLPGPTYRLALYREGSSAPIQQSTLVLEPVP
jgi:hypothetical protein